MSVFCRQIVDGHMVNPDYAPLKDIQQMIDAVCNACVEVSECGDLMMAGKCADMSREMELEMLRVLARLSGLASTLSEHFLENSVESLRERKLLRKWK